MAHDLVRNWAVRIWRPSPLGIENRRCYKSGTSKEQVHFSVISKSKTTTLHICNANYFCMSTLVSKYCWKPLEFYLILSSDTGAWMIHCKCIYQVAVMMSYRIQPYMLVYSDFLTSNHVSGFEEQTMSWTVLALYKRLWIALQFGVHKMYYRELALHHHQNQCNLDYLISIPGSSCQLLKHIVTCLIMNNHLQLWVRSHSWFSSSETNFLLRSSAGLTTTSRASSHSDIYLLELQTKQPART